MSIMPTVPFDSIGPGQSARIAMQVMGRDGPVFNPNGIRYLPVDGFSEGMNTSIGTLAQAATALAGVNLLVSAGTLVLSAATLAEVRRVSAKVDRLIEGQVVLGKQLDKVLAKLERIEIKVSEARLAQLVKHATSQAALEANEISFDPFAELAGDLQSFIEDAKVIRGVPSGLRLGSDVRAQLNGVVRILRGSRLAVADALNRVVGAEMVWRCDPVDDYWGREEESIDVKAYMDLQRLINAWDLSSWNAHLCVYERFSFDEADDHDALQDGLDHPIRQLWKEFGLDDEEAASRVAKARTRVVSTIREVPSGTIPWLHQPFSDAYGKEIMQESKELWFRNPDNVYILPPSIIDAAWEGDSLEDAQAALRSYRTWWLHHTDAGLVYRAWCECSGVAQGYEVGWPEEVGALLPAAGCVAGQARSLPAPTPILIDLKEVASVA